MPLALAQTTVQTPERDTDDIRDALRPILDKLSRKAVERVGKRQAVEKRWLEDLRQYNSIYEPGILKDLREGKRSELFINLTRPKTNTCRSKLSDMLFPTDDKNWGINPTPVPQLTQAAQQSADTAYRKAEEANAAVQAQMDPSQAVAEGNQAALAAAHAKAVMDEARPRAKAMEDEIDDQLRACNYAIECRKVIADGCSIGTGILKGPIAKDDRSRRSWAKDETGAYRLAAKAEERPAFVWVDPWSLFPDPDALSPEDSEDWFERHIYREHQLRKLAKQPGFDQDAIRRLIENGAKSSYPTYVSQLRAITDESSGPTGEVYLVWEYRGNLTAKDLETVCDCMAGDVSDKMRGMVSDIDPLVEISVVLWFCDSEVLKFGLNPLDSCESLYSFYTPEKDPASIWGHGIPWQMRDPQSALNGAFRALMDNAGLSTGPLLEIDTEVIEPANGKWVLEPRKIFRRKAGVTGDMTTRPGIRATNIDAHMAELAEVINLCKDFIDETTNISVLAAGEQGTHTTQTAQGMSILMNAVNVIFRDMVKNFDDGITSPSIRRIYDWNMQFSEKEDIKGDYDVDARGSSVLLVREVESQNLMALANLTEHPVIGQILKAAPIVRRLVKSMMIPEDEATKTDDEIRADESQKQGQPDPEAEKLQMQLTIARENNANALKIAELDRETKLMQIGQQHNIKLDQIEADGATTDKEIAHKERSQSAEIAIAATMPPKAAQTVAGSQ